MPLPTSIHVATGRSDDRYIWVFFEIEEAYEAQRQRLLQATAPLQPGELVGHTDDAEVTVATEDYQVQRRALAQLYAPTLEKELKDLTQIAFADLGSQAKSMGFLRVLREPGFLADGHKLKAEVLEGSWIRLRQPPADLKNFTLSLRVGAQKVQIKPKVQAYSFVFQNQNGFFAFYDAPPPSASVSCRAFGRDGTIHCFDVPVRQLLERVSYPLGRRYGFDVRLSLEVECVIPQGEHGLTELLMAIGSSTDAHDRLVALTDREVDRLKVEKRTKLEARQKDAQQRRKVFKKGAEVAVCFGPEPTCENEVLIMVGKLETVLDNLFPKFRVLEHTGQEGIDGLIEAQFLKEAIPEEMTVEFEYALESFFRHGHPIFQTRVVVCWTMGRMQEGEFRFGEGGLRADGALRARLEKSGWTWSLNYENHVIRVLPLENCPVIEIR